MINFISNWLFGKKPGFILAAILLSASISTVHAKLSGINSQLWSQDSAGISGSSEPADWFGQTHTACDFNGDGFSDLAVGAPHETYGASNFGGFVNIIYGSAEGLSSLNSQSSAEGPAVNVADNFGDALASGDFNGDGYCDLAIGVPGYDLTDIAGAGVVYVINGMDTGLDWQNWVQWDQSVEGIDGIPEPGDSFGTSLAVGDFDGNGRDDLAIGVPGEDIGTTPGAGAVQIIYAGPANTGLTTLGTKSFNQGGVLQSQLEVNDQFGEVLAAGDFDGNGSDDLAIGVPEEDVGEVADAGVVHVLYSSYDGGGLSEAGNQVWQQGALGVQDIAESYDRFGKSLASGDFDGDGRDDLAIGVPFEDYLKVDSGAFHVLYSAPNGGLASLNNQLFTQATGTSLPYLATNEEGDRFGTALVAADFNGDGKDDIAIGIAKEDIEIVSQLDAGSVIVIYALDENGLSPDGGMQRWTQVYSDIPGEAAEGDYFGASLSAGDFDGNGRPDLAVGAPGEPILFTPPIDFGGEVNVIYSSDPTGPIFQNSFESQ